MMDQHYLSTTLPVSEVRDEPSELMYQTPYPS